MVKRVKAIRRALVVLAAVTTALGLSLVPASAATVPPRVDLKVLVVTDGTPWVDAIQQQLASEGVPTTVVDLNDGARPAITSGYLSDVLADGTPHAHFQGVVLPNAYPAGMSADELTALAAFERSFSVRQIDGYVYPNSLVGTNPPDYAGSLDGATVTVTDEALAAGFGYLDG